MTRGCCGFTTTYAITAYHHWCCEFESRSGQWWKMLKVALNTNKQTKNKQYNMTTFTGYINNAVMKFLIYIFVFH
jgi:hypothetical protein